MPGRKTINIKSIIEKLPSNIILKTSTYVNTQTYATFIDSDYGEFQAKPHDVINRGRKHPKRNAHRANGGNRKTYSVKEIENKINQKLQLNIFLISYNGIGENCEISIDNKIYKSKPSRLLQGKLPKEFLKKQNKLKDVLTLEKFKEKLLSIRDDVEIISYNENYKKEKSLFLFKNFSNPVYMIPLSILNGSLHPSQRAKNSMEIYFNKTGFINPSQNPEVRKKIFSKQGMSLPEKKINEFLQNRKFNFKYNSQLNNKGKFWDFIIFKNNEPKIIIEIDGEFVHGLLQDGNSSLVNGIKDAERFQNINEKIIYLQCDSKKIENLYEEILRVFEVDYDDWLNEIVERCLKLPFPYPTYNHDRMIKDYKNLCLQKEYKKNLYTGNSIILNFHRSIYSSHRENCLSPLQAWHDRDKLIKCIKNRFIYSSNLSSMNIARGFEKNKIAPRVSVFQPSLAKYIIEKYSSDCETIIDPFSGFSGRMLGATSLNKLYFGFDCKHEVFVESLQIKKFLNLNNVHLEVKNIIYDKYEGEYDLLITCPPYENKEIWFNNQKSFKIDYYIDLCLTKIKAKKYIFVIDDIKTKYEKYFVNYITNQSHFSKNKEKILIF